MSKSFIVPILLLASSVIARADIVPVETNTTLRSVYLIPEKDSKVVQVIAVFLAGEVDSTGPEGLPHYLEHLMFWHAEKIRGETVHGRTGNAWINQHITVYHNSLRLEATMQNLRN
ncbi:MAG: hypothetical protein ACR2OR_02710 [Hyphomicrobiales bacterium]